MTPEEKMDAAVESYLKVADVLSGDVNAILDQEADTEAWRRTYIRTVGAMISGDSYSIQQIAAVGLETDVPKLSVKEAKAFSSDNQHSAIDQIKYVLRGAYKMFELEQTPDFSGNGWGMAKKFVDKRSKIMHPKSAADLHVSEEEWKDIFEGSKWLIGEHFALIQRMENKYGEDS
ncbi:MAG: hypothetical protein Q7U10_03670 [Thermodesulfovibrionia bacterium]|nr:hypothetical protein [Thermodesulfovibrionia bacterium]